MDDGEVSNPHERPNPRKSAPDTNASASERVLFPWGGKLYNWFGARAWVTH